MVFIKERSSLDKLKSLRRNVNWKIKKQRLQLLSRLYPLISNWEGPLPNLLDLFRPEEIEDLLLHSLENPNFDDDDIVKYDFIEFVVRTGYKDEPKVNEDGKPLSHRTTALHRAARNGPGFLDGTTHLFFYIYDRFDVNFIDEFGSTHFHVACMTGSVEPVEKFLEFGQDPNCPMGKSKTLPLFLALGSRNKDVVRLLLRNGADPNLAIENSVMTPLHFLGLGIEDIERRDDSITHERIKLVQMIFEDCHDKYKPVNVEARDESGNTALLVTLKEGFKLVVEVLLRRGADPNVADSDGSTALHIICKKKDSNVWAKMLFQVCDEVSRIVQVDARDNKGRTPLQLAVANFKPDVVDLLLNHGADLSSFVFPTESYFGKIFQIRRNDHESKLRLASGALAVVASLEKKGYELGRSDALMIMKFFTNYGLLEKSTNPNNCWYDDEKFTSGAKKIMVTPSLSLYDLIQLRPQKAARRLTFKDYFEFARKKKLTKLPVKYREACVGHLCEKLSRRFFLGWAMEPFMGLIHYRLPLLCCDMVLEELRNKDLYSICLADQGQSS